jgi:hypothetical protein
VTLLTTPLFQPVLFLCKIIIDKNCLDKNILGKNILVFSGKTFQVSHTTGPA